MTHLKSMTAYGRAQAPLKSGRLVCEMQSLNRRHLDITLALPPCLSVFDYAVRTYLFKHLGRGHVQCTFRLEGDLSPTLDLPSLEKVKENWRLLATHCQLDSQMPATFLLAFKDVLFGGSPNVIEESLVFKVCDEALRALQSGKEQEGEALAGEMLAHIHKLRHYLGQIQERAPQIVTQYRKKLLNHLKDMHDNIHEDERILKEIALFAERCDISEEIERIHSHLAQFEQWLHLPFEEEKQTKGKKGEFLLQELSRETNTIGAKASDLFITQQTLEMKVLLEKLREQMQNIE